MRDTKKKLIHDRKSVHTAFIHKNIITFVTENKNPLQKYIIQKNKKEVYL